MAEVYRSETRNRTGARQAPSPPGTMRGMDWKRRAVILSLLFLVTVVYLSIRYEGATFGVILGLAVVHIVVFVVALLAITLLLSPLTGQAVARVLPRDPRVTPSIDPETPTDLVPLDRAWRDLGLTATTPVILNATPPIHIHCYLHPERPLMATLTRSANQKRVVTGLLSSEAGDGRFLETIEAIDLDLYPIPDAVVRQALPGAGPAQLLARHIEAMDLLRWEFQPIDEPDAGAILARSYRLVRNLYVETPIRNGLALWWRMLTRRTPNRGPIATRR